MWQISKKQKSTFSNFFLSTSSEENAPGPDFRNRPGAGSSSGSGWRQLLQEVVRRKFGERVVHHGLDEPRDLLPNLRFDLVDDQLTVLVDELVDGVGQGRKLSVEEVLESDVCAANVEVDVSVEDAQLLVARGTDRNDRGGSHSGDAFKGGLKTDSMIFVSSCYLQMI